ncbi:alpha/beta fold hydrolase [Paenibacillaceae bacterium WGS1546]|uniref:alpha/beta hydrolase n=1 Tax=Cohnella sp. WGS1546 TaxID=3366810 RepID=UPI00372D72A8
MPYILRENVQIYYEYEQAKSATNDAETIILIHGLAFDMRTWDYMIPFMGDYHILRYDYRGHGQSDNGEEPLNDIVFTNDLAIIMDSLNIKKAHLIAHGAGAIIALFFSKYYSDKVQSTILLSLPLFHTEETAIKYTNYRKVFDSIEALADHVLSNVTLFQQGTPEMNKLYQSYLNTTINVYLELLDFFLNHHHEVKTIFKEHRKPTLFLTGEQDMMYPTYLSSLIASVNPICRYMTIYNASNMVFYDQPEETFKQIRTFWATNSNISSKPIDPLLLDLHSDFSKLINSHHVIKEPVLTVNLINKFEVFVNHNPIVNGWSRRSAKEILIYLIFNPKVTRDQLCEDVWRDIEIRKARNQLRVCLNHLKQLLSNHETNLLHIDKKQIILTDNIQSDLLSLLKKVKDALQEREIKLKEKIISEIFIEINTNIFNNLNDDWSLHIRTKTEIQLIILAREQVTYLKSEEKFIEAIAFLKIILMFNEDEPNIFEEIADLYERSNYLTEAKKWKDMALELHTC